MLQRLGTEIYMRAVYAESASYCPSIRVNSCNSMRLMRIVPYQCYQCTRTWPAVHIQRRANARGALAHNAKAKRSRGDQAGVEPAPVVLDPQLDPFGIV